MATNQNQRPTKEEIGNANVGDVFKLCNQYNVDVEGVVSLEAMKQKLVELICDTSLSHSEMKQSQVRVAVPGGDQSFLDEVGANFEKQKVKVLQMYDQVEEVLKGKDIDEFIKADIERRYENCSLEIENKRKDLQEGDIPIVVTGETSAGKSSFLNLLMGTELLPTSVLKCTGTICRIRNSETRKLIVTDFDDKQTEFKYTDDNTFRDKVKEFTTIQSQKEHEKVKYVDIFWPLSILRGNLTIVDTPGVSENPQLTSRLFEYLPNALAFLYVLNTPNDGGTQTDRLGRILNEISNRKKKGQQYDFDTRETMFICNKWDQVPSDECDSVWKNVYETLCGYWPGVEESQLFKFSTKKKEVNEPLFEALHRLIQESLDAKMTEHTSWIKTFLHSILHVITTRINISRMRRPDKKKFLKDKYATLQSVIERVQQKKESLNSVVDGVRDMIAMELHSHLQNRPTQRKMFNWIEDECPDIEKGSPKEILEKIILRCITIEITHWYNKSSTVRSQLERIYQEFVKHYSDFENDFNSLKDEMSGVQETLTKHRTLQARTLHIFAMKKAWKQLLLGIFIALPSLIRNSFERAEYMGNKVEYMNRCTNTVVGRLKKDVLTETLETGCFVEIKQKLHFAFHNTLEKHIESEKTFIDHLRDSASHHTNSESPCLQARCEEIIGACCYFEQIGVSKFSIPFSDIHIEEELGCGYFSTVDKVTVEIKREHVTAAMKIIKEPLKDRDWFSHFSEVGNWRHLDHRNIVKLIGLSVMRDKKLPEKLCIIMELCDATLERKMKEMPACCELPINGTEFATSFAFYADMGRQICEGLQYIHDSGCIHRNLKLDNILIRGDAVKISDVGVMKRHGIQKGTQARHMYYIAPEVYMEEYTRNVSAIDIYSLAFVLWELWYGTKVCYDAGYTCTRNAPLGNFPKFVITGGRPSLKKVEKPFNELRGLIQACSHQQSHRRPTAENVGKMLKQFKSAYSSE